MPLTPRVTAPFSDTNIVSGRAHGRVDARRALRSAARSRKSRRVKSRTHECPPRERAERISPIRVAADRLRRTIRLLTSRAAYGLSGVAGNERSTALHLGLEHADSPQQQIDEPQHERGDRQRRPQRTTFAVLIGGRSLQARTTSGFQVPPVADAIDFSSESSVSRKRYSAAAGSGTIIREIVAAGRIRGRHRHQRDASASTDRFVAARRDLAERHVRRSPESDVTVTAGRIRSR